MDIRKSLLDSIKFILLDNEKVNISNIKLDYKSIYYIILNNKVLTYHDKYIFNYNCINCGSNHQSGIKQFLKKINNGTNNCCLCRNNKIVLINDLISIHYKSIESFNNLDDDYKDKYYLYHLTENDYNRIHNNIISFHNNNLSNIDDYEYWSVFNINNKYISVLYDNKNNSIIKPYQPILKCDICNNNWKANSLEKFKNCLKIICNNCLSNKQSNIYYFKNCDNKQISYYSKLELKFIKWCNTNNILVNNGPLINFNNKKYKVGFIINNNLIEIVDKKHINTNKIDAINSIIKNYNNLYIIHSNNWIKQLNNLVI
jgi:hypothetical protein